MKPCDIINIMHVHLYSNEQRVEPVAAHEPPNKTHHARREKGRRISGASRSVEVSHTQYGAFDSVSFLQFLIHNCISKAFSTRLKGLRLSGQTNQYLNYPYKAKDPYFLFIYGTPYCLVHLLTSIFTARCKTIKSHRLKRK